MMTEKAALAGLLLYCFDVRNVRFNV